MKRRSAALIVFLASAGLWLGWMGLSTRHPEEAVRVGRVFVNPGLGAAVLAAERVSPGVWAKCLREERFVQGYGGVMASRGTHRDGWCLDVATGTVPGWAVWRPVLRQPLSDDEVREMVKALEAAGFAAPLRVVGYNLGGGLRVLQGQEHIHAAYRGQANYVACYRATRPGGKAHIDRMLKAL